MPPLNRREMISGAAALSVAASPLTAIGAARESRDGSPESLAWSGPQMLEAFMKARSSLRDEVTIGWMDATTYAIMGGETAPLYRLLAATWQRHHKVNDTTYDGRTLEIAFYLDVASGKRLETLKMPRTGNVVTVPNYRAGPSANKLVVEEHLREDFNMARETQGGNNFFRSGVSVREQQLSQPQRHGADFLIRQTLGAQVFAAGSDRPAFFYDEWTINRAPWRDIADPRVVSTSVEVQYSSIAAFRPWMQMQGVDGHTLQTGRGGKVARVEALPPQLLAMAREFHPDLITNPAAALA